MLDLSRQMLPLLGVLISVALLTFTVLGYIEAGDRITLIRFAKSFYAPTAGYSVAAALIAFGRTIVGFF